MKKSLLVMAMICLVFTASNAQTSKGSWLVGGGISFSSSKTGDFKQTDFAFTPGAGYFFANNFAAGATVGFASSKEEGEDAATLFSFNPFLRYYFVELGPKAKLFGNGSFGFGSAKISGESESFTAWEISAGPAIFLNPHVALEIAVAYGSTKFKDADDATNTFGAKVGLQIHLGPAAKK
ncbi:MAG: outer membrane beta-barrel protein [Ferruginibacter sp.]